MLSLLLAATLSSSPTAIAKDIPTVAMRATKKVEPKYPSLADSLHLKGFDCAVEVLIDKKGYASEVTPEDCPEPFLTAITAALFKWEWTPHEVDDRASKAKWRYAYNFEPESRPSKAVSASRLQDALDVYSEVGFSTVKPDEECKVRWTLSDTGELTRGESVDVPTCMSVAHSDVYEPVTEEGGCVVTFDTDEGKPKKIKPENCSSTAFKSVKKMVKAQWWAGSGRSYILQVGR